MPAYPIRPSVPLSPYSKSFNRVGTKALHSPSGYTPDLYQSYDRQDNEKQQLIDIPDVRQPNDYACGAACAMAVAQYFGVGPEYISEWEKELGTNRATSTHPFAIRDYLISLGLQVEARDEMTLEDLHSYWQQGIPVICPIQEYGNPLKEEKHPEKESKGPKPAYPYGHWVVVIGGPALGNIYVQDPSIENILEGEEADNAEGRMMIPVKEWLKVWHDKDKGGNKFTRFGIAVGSLKTKLKLTYPEKEEKTILGSDSNRDLRPTPRSAGNVFGQGEVTDIKRPVWYGTGQGIGGYEMDSPPRRRKSLDSLHEFSTVQMNISDSNVQSHATLNLIKQIQESIDPEDLAEKGLEDEPHITVKYGLHSNDPNQVQQAINDWQLQRGHKPIRVKLGKLSIFPADENKSQRGGSSYDVLKIDVNSPDLYSLNRFLGQKLDHTDTFPKYIPHITIGYLLPGLGKKYSGDVKWKSDELEFDTVSFRDINGTKTSINIQEQPKPSNEAGWKCEHPPCEWSVLQSGDEGMDMEKPGGLTTIHDQEPWELAHPDRWERSEIKGIDTPDTSEPTNQQSGTAKTTLSKLPKQPVQQPAQQPAPPISIPNSTNPTTRQQPIQAIQSNKKKKPIPKTKKPTTSKPVKLPPLPEDSTEQKRRYGVLSLLQDSTGFMDVMKFIHDNFGRGFLWYRDIMKPLVDTGLIRGSKKKDPTVAAGSNLYFKITPKGRQYLEALVPLVKPWEANEVDWRPSEMLPEDYYTHSLPNMKTKSSMGEDFTFYRQAYNRWRVKPDILGERRLRQAYERRDPADQVAIENDEEYRTLYQSGTHERFHNQVTHPNLPYEAGLTPGEELEDQSDLPPRPRFKQLPICPDGRRMDPATRTCIGTAGSSGDGVGLDEMHIESNSPHVGSEKQGVGGKSAYTRRCPNGEKFPIGSGTCGGRLGDSWDGVIQKDNDYYNENEWHEYPDYAPVVGLDIRDEGKREKPIVGPAALEPRFRKSGVPGQHPIKTCHDGSCLAQPQLDGPRPDMPRQDPTCHVCPTKELGTIYYRRSKMKYKNYLPTVRVSPYAWWKALERFGYGGRFVIGTKAGEETGIGEERGSMAERGPGAQPRRKRPVQVPDPTKAPEKPVEEGHYEQPEKPADIPRGVYGIRKPVEPYESSTELHPEMEQHLSEIAKKREENERKKQAGEKPEKVDEMWPGVKKPRYTPGGGKVEPYRIVSPGKLGPGGVLKIPTPEEMARMKPPTKEEQEALDAAMQGVKDSLNPQDVNKLRASLLNSIRMGESLPDIRKQIESAYETSKPHVEGEIPWSEKVKQESQKARAARLKEEQKREERKRRREERRARRERGEPELPEEQKVRTLAKGDDWRGRDFQQWMTEEDERWVDWLTPYEYEKVLTPEGKIDEEKTKLVGGRDFIDNLYGEQGFSGTLGLPAWLLGLYGKADRGEINKRTGKPHTKKEADIAKSIFWGKIGKAKEITWNRMQWVGEDPEIKRIWEESGHTRPSDKDVLEHMRQAKDMRKRLSPTVRGELKGAYPAVINGLLKNPTIPDDARKALVDTITGTLGSNFPRFMYYFVRKAYYKTQRLQGNYADPNSRRAGAEPYNLDNACEAAMSYLYETLVIPMTEGEEEQTAPARTLPGEKPGREHYYRTKPLSWEDVMYRLGPIQYEWERNPDGTIKRWHDNKPIPLKVRVKPVPIIDEETGEPKTDDEGNILYKEPERNPVTGEIKGGRKVRQYKKVTNEKGKEVAERYPDGRIAYVRAPLDKEYIIDDTGKVQVIGERPTEDTVKQFILHAAFNAAFEDINKELRGWPQSRKHPISLNSLARAGAGDELGDLIEDERESDRAASEVAGEPGIEEKEKPKSRAEEYKENVKNSLDKLSKIRAEMPEEEMDASAKNMPRAAQVIWDKMVGTRDQSRERGSRRGEGGLPRKYRGAPPLYRLSKGGEGGYKDIATAIFDTVSENRKKVASGGYLDINPEVYQFMSGLTRNFDEKSQTFPDLMEYSMKLANFFRVLTLLGQGRDSDAMQYATHKLKGVIPLLRSYRGEEPKKRRFGFHDPSLRKKPEEEKSLNLYEKGWEKECPDGSAMSPNTETCSGREGWVPYTEEERLQQTLSEPPKEGIGPVVRHPIDGKNLKPVVPLSRFGRKGYKNRYKGFFHPQASKVELPLAVKKLDDQGGEIPPDRMMGRAKEFDFITLPETIEGTNCTNCDHRRKKGDGYICMLPELRGLPVTSRNCCSAWDNRKALRAWEEGDRRGQHPFHDDSNYMGLEGTDTYYSRRGDEENSPEGWMGKVSRNPRVPTKALSWLQSGLGADIVPPPEWKGRQADDKDED